MHQRFFRSQFISIIVFCLLGIVSCESSEKEQISESKPKDMSMAFKAQLKTSFCAFNIVQIKDSAFFKYGVTWKDSQGKTYENVFSVKNFCDFNNEHIKVDELFNCKIVEKAMVDTCATCLGFMETPPLLHNIQVVK